MSINLQAPELRELKPRIMVCGVGGAGGNAVNNMITSGLVGVDFIVANTDAQALTASQAERIIQMGLQVTEGLGAGSQPDVGRAAAEEAIEEIRDHLSGAHMCFVTAGMGGGTGTGAAPVIAHTAREMGILTVGVVTKPFQFEGQRRMRIAESGIDDLQAAVDTLIVIPNQNLFRVANEKTTFADAFAMADQVLYSGVSCITDLMVKEGLINLDFADVRSIMREMGKAMMGTGEASGEKRAIQAAEAAIANPLLDETSMKGARGLLISITGGNDLTLYEVDEAASRIRQEVDDEANIILGATFDQSLDGIVRVSVVATGIDHLEDANGLNTTDSRINEVAQKLRSQNNGRNEIARQQPAGRPATIETVPPVAAAPQPAERPRLEAAPAPAAPQERPQESKPAPVAAQRPVEEAPWQGHNLPPQQVMDEVFLQPTQQPKAVSYTAPPPPPAPAQEEYAPQSFIPEPAEEPMRPTRMPQVEELPVPAQNQLREREARASGEAPQGHAAEAKRRSLLERLASFSMHRDPEPAPQQRGEPVAPMPQGHMAPAHAPAAVQAPQQAPQQAPAQARPAPVQAQAPVQGHAPAQAPAQAPAYSHAPVAPASANPAPSAAHAEYGKRPAAPQPRGQQPQLDLHGRPAPQQRSLEDEQLEIPAFLRRQTG